MTGGKPYTSELFEEVKKMKLHNDSLDRKLKERLRSSQSNITLTAATNVKDMSHLTMISSLPNSSQRKAKLSFLLMRNFVVGTNEEKHLTTGLHTIDDIYYMDCNEVLDWKYEQAVEPL
ncbi:hypothetical protein H5410_022847 [Solanum commersonii]|uniref:Yippee domain-containing protein n=1 Tax=Solanum commersonii TaxID=4109 RepID=A0A9J5ZJS0_SOLCO|nr:hypothetical protein H5410_022847 [Solanum commersonii]